MYSSTLLKKPQWRLPIIGMALMIAASRGLAQETADEVAKPDNPQVVSDDEVEESLKLNSAHIRTVRERLADVKAKFGEGHPETKHVQAILGDELKALEALERSKIEEHHRSLLMKIKEAADAERAAAQEQAIKAQEQLAVAKQAYEDQLAAQQRLLPPVENGEVKVFQLKNLQAADATKTIENLFGAQQMRLAVDDRTNTLVAFGTPDSLAIVEALLLRLDQQRGDEPPQQTVLDGNSPSRSLLLRVFWLADNLPEGEGQAPEQYLPKKVIQATERLGLAAPRLVAQTVNSLAVNGEGHTLSGGPMGLQMATPIQDRNVQEYTTRIPAIVWGQIAELKCAGTLSLADSDRTKLQIQIQVAGGAINCELSGSVSAPLGHYMVLGTANSVVAPQPMMAGGMGMGGMPFGGGMGRGGGGYSSSRGWAPGGPAGEGDSGDESVPVNPTGLPGGGGGAPPSGAGGPGMPGEGPVNEQAGLNASRFAFVVQVIEGESFPAEE